MRGRNVLVVLAVLLVSLAVWATPVSAYADGNVARVNGVEYTTVSDALKAALAGDSSEDSPAKVEILQSCNLDATIAIQANKHLTIWAEEGAGVILTDNSRRGITLSTGSSLEVQNITLNTNGQIYLNGQNGTLHFVNAGLNMDGEMYKFRPTGYYCGAISLEQIGADLTFDGSNVKIENYCEQGSAVRWDAADGDGYRVSIINGTTFESSNCYAGFTGTCHVLIEDSEVNVHDHRGNGANGSHFNIADSTVYFNDNGSNGLSAGILTIDHSTVYANGNGMNGIITNNVMQVVNQSNVTVEHNLCSTNSQWTHAAAICVGAGDSKIENSTVTVRDNLGGGIYQKSATDTLTISDNATVVIQGNTAKLKEHGGGVYVNGTMSLGARVALYNNHAEIAGDDIYCSETGTVTFSQVDSSWRLDGTRLSDIDEENALVTDSDDCTEAIDGWYMDAEGARWEAHADDPANNIVELYPVNGTTTVTGPTALKAAHGITATVTPADITIYMGGTEGYESVITGEQGTGDVVGAESDSLPEPGFYITLPECINEALKAEVGDAPGAVDLSDRITFRTATDDPADQREWHFEMYGATASVAYDRFVYRLVPAAGQDPIRLQFTSGDQFFTSDDFDPATIGRLNNQYTMGVYPGDVDQNNIVMDIEVGGRTYTYTVEVDTATLNIRYVTGEQADVVTDVVSDIADAPDAGERAYAVLPDDTRYTINQSDIDIDVTEDAAPSLLFDDVVSDENTAGAQNYDEQLRDRAVEVAVQNGAALESVGYEAKYLDLVDANNGNVWLQASEPVTVYWPYPEGTDQNTEFHLVHFEGLNRELANGEIAGGIANAPTSYIEVENTEHGIRFTTDGFSPFVLMWDASEEPVPTPDEPATKPAKPVEDGTLAATGDSTPVLIAGIAAAGAACVAISFAVRKHGKA